VAIPKFFPWRLRAVEFDLDTLTNSTLAGNARLRMLKLIEFAAIQSENGFQNVEPKSPAAFEGIDLSGVSGFVDVIPLAWS